MCVCACVEGFGDRCVSVSKQVPAKGESDRVSSARLVAAYTPGDHLRARWPLPTMTQEYSKRHPLFWATVGYVVVSRAWLDDARLRLLKHAEDSEADAVYRKAFVRTFSVFHRVVWLFSVAYLASLEFAHLYCGGQTVLGFYVGKFASFLSSHEQYSLARRVMRVVVLWNKFWLGDGSTALAPSLKQAAVVSVLAKRDWWKFVKDLSRVRRAK